MSFTLTQIIALLITSILIFVITDRIKVVMNPIQLAKLHARYRSEQR